MFALAALNDATNTDIRPFRDSGGKLLLWHGGNDAAAIEHYRRAIAINPDYADAHVNWGNALVRGARFAEAIDHYGSALTINAENADAQRNWGVALAQQGKLANTMAKESAP